MKREHYVRPGYDCRKECLHEPKGEHGICGDTWFYVVSDGKRAVSLEILSDRYPPTVERALLPDVLQKPMAACLVTHVADPDADPEQAKCKWVEGGLCRVDGSYLGARAFWNEHGDPKQPEQGEAFWLALEAELPE